MMRIPTAGVTDTVKNCKKRPVNSTASSRPFVVCSVNTKRYAPSIWVPVKKLSATPTSTMARGVRPCPLPSAIPKAEPRRPAARPVPMPTVQKSLRLPPAPSFRQVFVNKPMAIAHRDRPTNVRPELPPRPSCIPRCRGSDASKAKHSDMSKVSGANSRDMAPIKLAVGIRALKGAVKGTIRNVKKHDVKHCAVQMTAKPAVPTEPFDLVPYVAQSPPPSPGLSSFPSQSWTIMVDVGIKQVKTPTTVCDYEVPSIIDAVVKPGAKETYSNTCLSESVSSSSASSSSPTVIEDSSSSATLTAELGDVVKLCTPTSTEVSKTNCDAANVSPSSSNGSPSTADLLAGVIDSHTSTTPAVLEPGNSTRTTVRRAIEMARTFFSPSRPASRLTTETTSARIIGGNVSRLRNLFVPPLDGDAKVSRNPATQIEIEMLRARKKVAGGGLVDPRLERLDSLSSEAVAAKRRDLELPARTILVKFEVRKP